MVAASNSFSRDVLPSAFKRSTGAAVAVSTQVSILTAVRNNDLGVLRMISASSPVTSSASTSWDWNERDFLGNNALHLAVEKRNHEMVHLLTATCPRVSLNQRDLESGYTPLHKAVYLGEVQIALHILNARRSDIDISVRDNEGLTCLDLLSAMISKDALAKWRDTACQALDNLDYDDDFNGEIECDPSSLRRSASRAYEASSAERMHPCSAALDSSASGPVLSASSSTVDPDEFSATDQCSFELPQRSTTSIWTWGKNSNFVLGNSISGDREFAERIDVGVPDKDEMVSLDNLYAFQPKIKMAVLSKYHHLTVTDSGLFVNGFGADGRLGLGHEETVLQPTFVEGIPAYVIAVAAGPDHTAVVLANGELMTWGSNRFGQLGYMTSVDKAGEYLPSLEPRSVAGILKRVRIGGVAASKYHTACYSESGLLYTWGHNTGQLGYQEKATMVPKKVTSFPQSPIAAVAATNSATAVLLQQSRDIYVFSQGETQKVLFDFRNTVLRTGRSFAIPSSVSKVISGNHQFAAVTTAGDVYLWSPPEDKEFANTWQQLNFPQSAPRVIWSAMKERMVAVDVAVGIDSTVLILTASGHVYIGNRRKNAKFKIGYNNSKSVSFFKFVLVPRLQNVVAVSASIAGAFSVVRCDPLPALPISSKRGKGDLRLIGVVRGDTLTSVIDPLFSDVLLISADGSSPPLAAHRLILGLRSPVLRAMFELGSAIHTFPAPPQNSSHSTTVFGLDLKKIMDEKKGSTVFEISYSGFSNESLALVLEWIYTGTYHAPWNDNPRRSLERREKEQLERLREEFNSIARVLQLGDTQVRGGEYRTTFYSSLSRAFISETISPLTDVMLRLKDGVTVLCHRIVLAARCRYFEALLGEKSHWRLKTDLNSYGHRCVVVDLSHIPREAANVALQWMYGSSTDRELFHPKTVARESFAGYFEFLIEVMGVANELLLSELKEVVAELLYSVLDLRNVDVLLEISDMYVSKTLKRVCIDFLCTNLETALETGALNLISDSLVTEIEAEFKARQVASLPYTRGPNSYLEKIRQQLVKEDEERKHLRRQEFAIRKESGSSVSVTKNDFVACRSKDIPVVAPSPLTSPLQLPSSSPSEPQIEDVFALELDDALTEPAPTTPTRSQKLQSQCEGSTGEGDFEIPSRRGRKAWKPLEFFDDYELSSSTPRRFQDSRDDIRHCSLPDQNSSGLSPWSKSPRPRVAVSLKEIMTEQVVQTSKINPPKPLTPRWSVSGSNLSPTGSGSTPIMAMGIATSGSALLSSAVSPPSPCSIKIINTAGKSQKERRKQQVNSSWQQSAPANCSTPTKAAPAWGGAATVSLSSKTLQDDAVRKANFLSFKDIQLIEELNRQKSTTKASSNPSFAAVTARGKGPVSSGPGAS